MRSYPSKQQWSVWSLLTPSGQDLQGYIEASSQVITMSTSDNYWADPTHHGRLAFLQICSHVMAQIMQPAACHNVSIALRMSGLCICVNASCEQFDDCLKEHTVRLQLLIARELCSPPHTMTHYNAITASLDCFDLLQLLTARIACWT